MIEIILNCSYWLYYSSIAYFFNRDKFYMCWALNKHMWYHDSLDGFNGKNK